MNHIENKLLFQAMNLITQEFQNDPICLYFSKPLENDKKNSNDFLLKNKKQMDLSTIKKKIKSNEYLNLQSWIDDMNFIWDNAIEIHTSDSVIGGVAIYLKKKFQKKVKMIKCYNIKNYEKYLIELTSKIQEMLKNIPSSDNFFNIYNPLNDKIEDLSISRIQKLKDKLLLINDNLIFEKIDEIIKINMNNSNFNIKNGLDLGKLNRNSLLEIEKLLN